MKHVFIINAHTPYLTALGAINYHKIEDKDVVFVLGRNYRCFEKREGISVYDLSDLYNYRLSIFNRRNLLNKLGEVKSFVDKTINEEFILYLPHLNYYFFQVFATHPLCKEIKFIEEGIVDFCENESMPEVLSIKSKVLNTLYFRNTDYWNGSRWNTYLKLGTKRVNETYAITDKLYQNIPCQHTVVKWPFIALKKDLDDEAAFYVFDSLVEQKIVDFDSYFSVCKKVIGKFHNKKNYVKFHPYQLNEVKQAILSFFSDNGWMVEELPNDIPFEMILCNKKHLKVCGFTTSLVFYASLMGHEAHIYMKDFMKIPAFAEYWRNFTKSLCMYGNIFKYEDI